MKVVVATMLALALLGLFFSNDPTTHNLIAGHRAGGGDDATRDGEGMAKSSSSGVPANAPSTAPMTMPSPAPVQMIVTDRRLKPTGGNGCQGANKNKPNCRTSSVAVSASSDSDDGKETPDQDDRPQKYDQFQNSGNPETRGQINNAKYAHNDRIRHHIPKNGFRQGTPQGRGFSRIPNAPNNYARTQLQRKQSFFARQREKIRQRNQRRKQRAWQKRQGRQRGFNNYNNRGGGGGAGYSPAVSRGYGGGGGAGYSPAVSRGYGGGGAGYSPAVRRGYGGGGAGYSPAVSRGGGGGAGYSPAVSRGGHQLTRFGHNPYH